MIPIAITTHQQHAITPTTTDTSNKKFDIHACYTYALDLSKVGELESAQRILLSLLENASDEAIELELQGLIYALLAEINVRQENYQQSTDYAKSAIIHGATYQGHRLLGTLARQKYALEDALTHFEYAASAAPRGSVAWIDVTCLIIDTLAQAGYHEAKRIMVRAREVLEYMQLHKEHREHKKEHYNDWTTRVQQHYARAQDVLQQNSNLN